MRSPVLSRFLAAALTTLPLAAQNPPPQVQTAWLGEHQLAVFPEPGMGRTAIRVESVAPDGSLAVREVETPEPEKGHVSVVDAYEGGFVVNLEWHEQGTDHTPLTVTRVLRSDAAGHWTDLGTLRQPYYFSARILPLTDGRFLARFGSPRRRDMGGAPSGGYHPLGLLRRASTSDLTLHLDAWQDLDLDKPYWKSPGAAALAGPFHLNENLAYPGLGLAFATGDLTRVGDHLVLPAMRAGWFFVFSAKDGRMERKIQLYPSVDEERLKDPSLGWVVVGYQPTPDGRLLVAARQEAGIASFRPVHASPDLSDEAFQKLLPAIHHLMDENLASYPVVMWYTLDLDGGTVHPEAPPRHSPDFIRTVEELERYSFRFQADGNLKFNAAAGTSGSAGS